MQLVVAGCQDGVFLYRIAIQSTKSTGQKAVLEAADKLSSSNLRATGASWMPLNPLGS